MLLYWGEARRIVSVGKYGTGEFAPHAPSMKRAAEKFKEAYRKDPDLKVAAARVAGVLRAPAAAAAIEDKGEGERQFAEVLAWDREALPYWEEYMPWALADYPRPQATPEQVARFFELERGLRSGDNERS